MEPVLVERGPESPPLAHLGSIEPMLGGHGRL